MAMPLLLCMGTTASKPQHIKLLMEEVVNSTVVPSQKEINMSLKDIQRFWSKVNKDGPVPDQLNEHYKGLEACWVWTSGKFISGYGQFSIQSHPHRAHRVSFWLANGTLPSKGLVCHKCDNQLCVNPDHLFDGSFMDNSDDLSKKGRRNPPVGDRNAARKYPEMIKRGEACKHAKITEEEVRQIRLMNAEKKRPLKVYQDMFNTTWKNAWSILNYVSWKHVLPELNPKNQKQAPV